MSIGNRDFKIFYAFRHLGKITVIGLKRGQISTRTLFCLNSFRENKKTTTLGKHHCLNT